MLNESEILIFIHILGHISFIQKYILHAVTSKIKEKTLFKEKDNTDYNDNNGSRQM